MPGAPIRCTHGHHKLACAKALRKHGCQTCQKYQSDTMQAWPALARASKGIAKLDLNMPGKHAGSTDTMHTRPPRTRMRKGIAANMTDKYGRSTTRLRCKRCPHWLAQAKALLGLTSTCLQLWPFTSYNYL